MQLHFQKTFANGEPTYFIVAKLDGFKNFDHFAEYHNKDFKGKIIHWTDFRF